jgi:deaminated glutathione amidase
MDSRDNDPLLAAIAMSSGKDRTANIARAEGLVREAARAGAHWVMLPEMFPFHGSPDEVYAQAEKEDGPLTKQLARLAKDLGIVLFAGSVAEKASDPSSRKSYNTSYVFDRDGAILAKYRKIHLFNLFDEAGNPTHCESNSFIAGEKAQTTTIDGYNVGFSICYDLRFGPLYYKLAEDTPLDVIAVPSAFTLTTGMYHWELLLRARAVEHLCYVFAANAVGVHYAGKTSFGHAMIVDPWGHKLSDSGNTEGIAQARISKTKIKHFRSLLPALANRRPELY